MPEFIYLDHHATTPMDPRVLEAMMPFFCERFGNPGGVHAAALSAKRAVEEARAQVAAAIHGRATELIFTSGATESDNLALRGALAAQRARGRDEIISQRTEHSAIVKTLAALQGEGTRVHFVEVDAQGFADLDQLQALLSKRTALASFMLANNEIGTVTKLQAIGERVRAAGALLHVDAAQGLGYVPLNVREMPVDLVSMSGHKIYGPKGVGALWTRRDSPRVELQALLCGGGQERGLRSGTQNVPGIVGMGAAASLQIAHGREEATRLRTMASAICARLCAKDGVSLLGPPIGEDRHPGNINLHIAGIDIEGFLLSLIDEIGLSTGAACAMGRASGSHVLKAIGADSSSIRIGLGRGNDEAQVTRATALLDARIDAHRAS